MDQTFFYRIPKGLLEMQDKKSWKSSRNFFFTKVNNAT